MKKVIPIQGLDCAACAAELEEELKALDGVRSASVSFVNQKISLEYEDDAALLRAIDFINNFEEVKVVEIEKRTVLHIENLDCPVCAEALRAELQKIKGVKTVAVDYLSQTISLVADSEDAIARVIKKANAFEEVRVLDGGRYATK